MGALELAKSFAGPFATIIAAAAAAWITLSFNSRQLQIARDQMLIADGQKKIAAAKLNLDLFDRRFAIFEAARKLLIEIVQHDHVDASDINKFNIRTADAVFLFDKDIETYLDGFRRKVVRLKMLNTQRDAAQDEAKRHALIDQASEQFMALAEELPIMIETFKPYLKLGNI
jgi:hypothetical protein